MVWHNRIDPQIMAQGAIEDHSRDDAYRTSSSSAMWVVDFPRGATGGFHSMTASWVPVSTSSSPHSGRIVDTARGILIGIRRCRSDKALDELHTAAQRHKVPVFAMAWALVHLAGDGEKTPSFTDAQSAARHEWGPLFGRSAAVPC
jgi:hypothetical protein